MDIPRCFAIFAIMKGSTLVLGQSSGVVSKNSYGSIIQRNTRKPTQVKINLVAQTRQKTRNSKETVTIHLAALIVTTNATN